MTKLLEAIAELVSNTPPKKIEQLARMISDTSGPEDTARLGTWTTASEAKLRLKGLIDAWQENPDISPAELASMLHAASFVHGKISGEQSIELVWTGPSSELVPTRKTSQALLQVINSASEKLFLTSFVTYKVDAIVDALNKATERDVTVSILLERSEADGGGVSNDGIAAMKKAVPRARVFDWAEREGAFSGGKVHAKVAVADEQLCFISSANLTGHAMEKNMEAGVLIKGGGVPKKLHQHLGALITTNQLKRK